MRKKKSHIIWDSVFSKTNDIHKNNIKTVIVLNKFQLEKLRNMNWQKKKSQWNRTQKSQIVSGSVSSKSIARPQKFLLGNQYTMLINKAIKAGTPWPTIQPKDHRIFRWFPLWFNEIIEQIFPMFLFNRHIP